MTHPALTPPLLQMADGRPVAAADWPARREALLGPLVDLQYGGMPPAPDHVAHVTLIQHEVRWLGDAPHEQHHVTARVGSGSVTFLLDVLRPPGDGPFPVLLAGDGCWRYVRDAVATAVLDAGFALATFNRCELAHDPWPAERRGPLFDACPGATFGALSAWAWGYQRCLDVIAQLDGLDARRVAIIGHSRGGKTVLLAAATDPRIAAVSCNASGCGGAGSFIVRNDGSERVGDIIRFTHWFGPRFADYADREHDLPFDQHVLLAAIAPRPLITIEAAEDKWANGEGTRAVHAATRPVYDLLGAPQHLRLHERPGRHTHALEDWQASLAFFRQTLA